MTKSLSKSVFGLFVIVFLSVLLLPIQAFAVAGMDDEPTNPIGKVLDSVLSFTKESVKAPGTAEAILRIEPQGGSALPDMNLLLGWDRGLTPADMGTWEVYSEDDGGSLAPAAGVLTYGEQEDYSMQVKIKGGSITPVLIKIPVAVERDSNQEPDYDYLLRSTISAVSYDTTSKSQDRITLNDVEDPVCDVSYDSDIYYVGDEFKVTSTITNTDAGVAIKDFEFKATVPDCAELSEDPELIKVESKTKPTKIESEGNSLTVQISEIAPSETVTISYSGVTTKASVEAESIHSSWSASNWSGQIEGRSFVVRADRPKANPSLNFKATPSVAYVNDDIVYAFEVENTISHSIAHNLSLDAEFKSPVLPKEGIEPDTADSTVEADVSLENNKLHASLAELPSGKKLVIKVTCILGSSSEKSIPTTATLTADELETPVTQTADVKIYSSGEVSDPVFNVSELNNLVSLSKQLLVQTTASSDGSDVGVWAYWATPEDIATFQAAIDAASAELKQSEHSQDTIDAATETLKAAKETFESKRSHGTKESSHIAASAEFKGPEALKSEGFKEAEELADTDVFSDQLNYSEKTFDGGSMYQTAQWLDPDAGKAQISIHAKQDAQELPSVYPLYITTFCNDHGFHLDVIKRNIKDLVEMYGSADVVVFGAPSGEANVDATNASWAEGTIVDYYEKTFTPDMVDEELSHWHYANGQADDQNPASGCKDDRTGKVFLPFNHFSCWAARALRMYFFGSADAPINPEAARKAPYVVYTSCDGDIYQGASAKGNSYATDDLYQFLVDQYCSDPADDRWISMVAQQGGQRVTIQTSGQNCESGEASIIGTRQVAALLDPTNWFDSKDASKVGTAYYGDYTYEQTFSELGFTPKLPALEIASEVSNKFKVEDVSAFVDGVPTGATCSGQVVSMSVPEYKGQDLALVMNVNVDPDVVKSVAGFFPVDENQSSMTYGENSEVLDPPKLCAPPEVKVEETSSSPYAQIDDVLDYHVTLTSSGLGALGQGTLEFGIPSEFTPTGEPSATSGTASFQDGKLVLPIENFAAGDTIDVDFQLVVNDSAEDGWKETVAEVGSGVFADPRAASMSVEIISPELQIAKTSSKDIAQADDIIDYSVSISNTGDRTIAHGTRLTDIVAPQVELVGDVKVDGKKLDVDSGVVPSSDETSVIENASGREASPDDVFDNILVGDLPAGVTRTFDFSVKVKNDPECGSINATSSVSANHVDTKSASKDTMIVHPTLTLEKSVDRDYAQADDVLNYTLQIENPVEYSIAHGTHLEDFLPPELEVVGDVTLDGAPINVDGDYFQIASEPKLYKRGEDVKVLMYDNVVHLMDACPFLPTDFVTSTRKIEDVFALQGNESSETLCPVCAHISCVKDKATIKTYKLLGEEYDYYDPAELFLELTDHVAIRHTNDVCKAISADSAVNITPTIIGLMNEIPENEPISTKTTGEWTFVNCPECARFEVEPKLVSVDDLVDKSPIDVLADMVMSDGEEADTSASDVLSDFDLGDVPCGEIHTVQFSAVVKNNPDCNEVKPEARVRGNYIDYVESSASTEIVHPDLIVDSVVDREVAQADDVLNYTIHVSNPVEKGEAREVVLGDIIDENLKDVEFTIEDNISDSSVVEQYTNSINSLLNDLAEFDESIYTEDSWQGLVDAMNEARSMLEKEGVLGEELKSAYENMLKAQNYLVMKDQEGTNVIPEATGVATASEDASVALKNISLGTVAASNSVTIKVRGTLLNAENVITVFNKSAAKGKYIDEATSEVKTRIVHPDLEIENHVSSKLAQPGDVLDYEIVVRNPVGSSEAREVKLHDIFSESLGRVSEITTEKVNIPVDDDVAHPDEEQPEDPVKYYKDSESAHIYLSSDQIGYVVDGNVLHIDSSCADYNHEMEQQVGMIGDILGLPDVTYCPKCTEARLTEVALDDTIKTELAHVISDDTYHSMFEKVTVWNDPISDSSSPVNQHIKQDCSAIIHPDSLKLDVTNYFSLIPTDMETGAVFACPVCAQVEKVEKEMSVKDLLDADYIGSIAKVDYIGEPAMASEEPISGDFPEVTFDEPDTSPAAIGLGTIAGGEEVHVRLRAEVLPSNVDSVSTEAKTEAKYVSEKTADTNTAIVYPKLAITQAVDKASAQTDDVLNYEVVVSNTGDKSVARNVVLSETLPTGLLPVGEVTVNGKGVDGSLNELSLGDIPNGTIQTINFAATVTELEKDSVNAIATAFSTGVEDVSAESTTKILYPTLEISKEVDKETVVPGETVNYVINIENPVEGTVAKNVSFQDVLPDGLENVSEAKVLGSSELTTMGIADSGFSGVLGDIEAGVPVQVSYSARANGSDGDTLINTAGVYGDHIASEQEPISDSANVLLSLSSLDIKKTASVESTQVGQDISYTVEITNTGNFVARDVEFRDTLGQGGSYVQLTSVEGGDMTPDTSENKMVGTISSIDPGKTVTIKYVVSTKGASTGDFVNTAEAVLGETTPVKATSTVKLYQMTQTALTSGTNSGDSANYNIMTALSDTGVIAIGTILGIVGIGAVGVLLVKKYRR